VSRGEAARSQSPGTGRKIATAPSSAPSRGLFRSPLIPTAYAVGYYLSPFGLENVLARFYARNHVSLNGAYEEFSFSRTAVIGVRRVKSGSISAA
jgi:hypothetical protein